MNHSDIRAGRIYTDGSTAVREVTRLSSLGAGDSEYVCVIYVEKAGLNRGRTNTMPIEAFARFAARTVKPSGMDEVVAGLGLAAYGLDGRTNEILRQSLPEDGTIKPVPEDAVRLEKLVGLGLATRIGRRLQASGYVVGAELLEAARRDARRTMPLAA